MLIAEHIIAREREQLHRFDPVGECIYCSKTENETRLTDEHIIPDGIGGNLLLPKASCPECQSRIYKYENECINSHLGGFRLSNGIRSRKRRKKQTRPYTYETSSYSGDDDHRSHQAHIGMPYFLLMEISSKPPGILSGISQQTGTSQFFVNGNGVPPGRSLKGKRFSTGSFPRMIAKIAHSYASAVMQVGDIKPYTLDYILSVGTDYNKRLIGDQNPDDAKNDLHRLRLEVEERHLCLLPTFPTIKKKVVIVYVQLFSMISSPVYQVVVGEFR